MEDSLLERSYRSLGLEYSNVKAAPCQVFGREHQLQCDCPDHRTHTCRDWADWDFPLCHGNSSGKQTICPGAQSSYTHPGASPPWRAELPEVIVSAPLSVSFSSPFPCAPAWPVCPSPSGVCPAPSSFGTHPEVSPAPASEH